MVLAIGVVVAGTLLAATLSLGAGGADPVRACVSAKSGAARLVASGARCRRGEKAVAWNVRGAAGPRGAKGAPGDAGVTGSAGAPGEKGAIGDKGARGSLSFDSFQGMPCTRPDQQSGTTSVALGSEGQVTFTCN